MCGMCLMIGAAVGAGVALIFAKLTCKSKSENE